MKTRLLTLITFLLTASAVSAQKPDTAQVMVHYKYSWVRDTNARDKPVVENMILLAGSNASVFKSYDRRMQMLQMRQQAQAQMNAGGPIQIKSTGRSTSSEIYMFPNEGKMVRRESIITIYLIEEPFPTINWKISSDTMTIGKLNCQKATAHFKGRDYTAWFTSDLPYRSGPWKLNGLPGLIVEAYDTRKEVMFKYDGLEPVQKAGKSVVTDATQVGNQKVIINGMGDSGDDLSVIALPDNGVKTTTKEFDNLKEAMRKDPQAVINGQMAGMGGGHITMNAPAPGMKMNIQTAPPVQINNPVELPEKK